MSASKLRTPAEWSALDGVTVMDPDGWRGSRTLPAKSWDEPIDRAEWEQRLSVSTHSLRTVQSEPVATLSVVDRVALRLMRTQVFGPSLEPRWVEIIRSRWTLLSDEGRENFRAVARALLADIALGDDSELPASREYGVRHDEHGLRTLDDIGDAVDFADHVWPGSTVFERSYVTVRGEWTEVTA